MKINRYLIIILYLFINASIVYASTNSLPQSVSGSLSWVQLFKLFVMALGAFAVIQVPMLGYLISMWLWTLYMKSMKRSYPSQEYIHNKLNNIQDCSDYIYWWGELGTFCGMFIAVIQLGMGNGEDKAGFAMALGLAIATSILGKCGQIVGKGPERRLAIALNQEIDNE